MTAIAAHGFPASVRSVDEVIAIARDIGQALLRKQAAIQDVQTGARQPTDDVWVKTKPDGSSVTSSDIWANAAIDEKLRHLSFDQDTIGIVSEESDPGANREAARKSACFVIDPLDNTGDYKSGHDNWSVTIGFEVDGQPTGGVVYYPKQAQLFFTADNGKAYCRDDYSGITTELSGVAGKRQSDLMTGNKALSVTTDFGVAAQSYSGAGSPVPVEAQHAVHTERYWQVGFPGGTDIAEHGDLFYAWDIVAPAAITARANVVYLNRNGTPLDFMTSKPGHNAFEMPRDGFIAGNAETLKNIDFLKSALPKPVVSTAAPAPALTGFTRP